MTVSLFKNGSRNAPKKGWAMRHCFNHQNHLNMRSQLQYSEMKWNDLPKCSLLTTFLFADDTTLFASADSLEELMLFVNSDLHKVVTFLELTKWFCTPQKTKFILFNCNEREGVQLFINKIMSTKMIRILWQKLNKLIPTKKFQL